VEINLNKLAKSSRDVRSPDSTEVRHRSRLLTALRLVIGAAVRCKCIYVCQVSRILSLLRTVKHVNLQLEISFLEKGGLGVSKQLFGFPKPSSSQEAQSWRSRVSINNGISIANAKVESATVLVPEILHCIIAFSDLKTICSSCPVSRLWNAAASVGQGVIWRRLFLDKWPDASSFGNFRERFRFRVEAAKSVKIPFGKKKVPRVNFCPDCDAVFTQRGSLKRHVCANKRKRAKIVHNT